MHPASKQNEHALSGWSIVVYVFMISIAVDAAAFISRMGHLNWICTALAVISAALLMGGLMFTANQMRKLER